MSGTLNRPVPEVLANSYPAYAELGRNAPVSLMDPGGFYAVRPPSLRSRFKRWVDDLPAPSAC